MVTIILAAVTWCIQRISWPS